jgi:antitoxin component YwqK of YwqJK toxin-antitoxin module
MIADGFVAGWYENGKVKKYKEIHKGKSHGLTVEWNLQGVEIERQYYQDGLPQS